MVEASGVMHDGHDELIMSVREGYHNEVGKHYGAGSNVEDTLRVRPCKFWAASSCAMGAKVSEHMTQARLVARHQCQPGQNRDIVAAAFNRRDFIDDLTGLPLPPD